jgi:predicted RNA binding protein YcfA (HicA-like mRNA interferase family)
VKRRDLVRHLERHGCELLREGGRHTVFRHRKAGRVSAIPRHREINGRLAGKICPDLAVPEPGAPQSR